MLACQRAFKILIQLFCICTIAGCSFLKPPRHTRFVHYPVEQGDTLHSISKQFGISAEDLRVINHIVDVRSIHVGSIVKVPLDQISTAPSVNGGSNSQGLSPARADSANNPQQKKIDKVLLSKVEDSFIGQLCWPVPGRKVTSKFGWRWFKFHEGVDIKAPEGTPVLAAHSGKVVHSGQGIRGYGNIVVLKTDGLLTVYAHNQRNHVRIGQVVTKCQKIASVGSTGKSTGPHLHFEVRVRDSSRRNVAVNPRTFFTGR